VILLCRIRPNKLPAGDESICSGSGFNREMLHGNATALEKEKMASSVYQRVQTQSTLNAQGRDHATRSGIWVAIFAITMSFAALTSALMVRQGSGDWSHIVLPRVMYLNTVILVLSSFAFEMARSRATRGTRVDLKKSVTWLTVTLLLGLLFVAGQYIAWRQLVAQGLYLATTPNSSFFYVFTAVHALHLLGGIAGLAYLISRIALSHPLPRWSSFQGTAIYWHFMDGLWLYLLYLISVRL
jgi:cytochrome c oxidase subunit III